MDTYWLLASVTGWSIAFGFLIFSGMQALQLRELRAEKECDAETIRFLKQELDVAQRNDARDAKGRYSSPDAPRWTADYETICVNPASYPPKR